MNKHWVMEAQNKLSNLSKLPENWNEEEGKQPSIPVYDYAKLFLKTLPEMDAPFICPLSNGGVQFEWDSNQKYLELEFNPNEIGFLQENKTHNTIMSGVLSYTDTQKLTVLLSWYLK